MMKCRQGRQEGRDGQAEDERQKSRRKTDKTLQRGLIISKRNKIWF